MDLIISLNHKPYMQKVIVTLFMTKKILNYLNIFHMRFIRINRTSLYFILIVIVFSILYAGRLQRKQHEEHQTEQNKDNCKSNIISLTITNNVSHNEMLKQKDNNKNKSPKGPLITFAGAGMLWAYYIGIVAFLRDHFDIYKSNISVSGISCGTFAAGTLFLDLTIQQGFEMGLEFQKFINNRRLKFMFISTAETLDLGMNLFNKFGVSDKLLADKYKKYGGSDAIYFGVTALKRFGSFHLPINNFTSVKNLFYGSLCSMRIVPFFRSPGYWNGYYVLDGCLSSNYTIPDKYIHYHDKVIRINSVPSYKSDIKPKKKFKLREWCVSGGLNDNLKRFNKGYNDAAKYMAIMNCVEKGLIWKHKFDYNTLYDTENKNEYNVWNWHLHEKINEWNNRITIYINNQS